jgi:hypothetical protein
MDGAGNQVLAGLADSIEEDKRLEERSRNILLETARGRMIASAKKLIL